MAADVPAYFHAFKSAIAQKKKPERFTFPFCYEPDEWSLTAAKELQDYLGNQQDFVHNFGLEPMEGLIIGKMFGVLVAEHRNGTIGYLAACSGKLAGRNQHRYFVPPIFDMLQPGSFFLKEEEQINALNRKIEELERDPILPRLRTEYQEMRQAAATSLAAFRLHMKKEKAERKEKRQRYKLELSSEAYQELEDDLIKQSYRDQHELDVLKSDWAKRILHIEVQIQQLQDALDELKNQRKDRSSKLQQQLFDQYQFLNARSESKSVRTIFEECKQMLPPAGAGECAAPKLLQYAYQHDLHPISMAEFWWGASPASEVRKHKNFYPACKSKCEPILSHMLTGLHVDPNPMLTNPAEGKDLTIIYEDRDIIVVDKPAEFLSVPGIHIQDSVYTRILKAYPEISGPVVVHRLDMSTSGILILAKHKDAHQYIQDQFIKHTIIKRYTALLDGLLEEPEGLIDLPLRVDLEDRPRQVVCYQYGKPARTTYTVVGHEKGNTRVHFFPLTGRTHQLRVHAAHQLGLNHPILGDDLYGTRSGRLHLHAGYIQFNHPTTKENVTFYVPDPF
ncbi:RluA family pseudouridine synthase [Sphingobacterium suaedae]